VARRNDGDDLDERSMAAGSMAIAQRLHRVLIPLVLCAFLSSCQLHGPIAEIYLGWGYEIEDVARLEKLFLLSGFEYEMQHYLSADSALESVHPWRYKASGVIYSYFKQSSQDADRHRAILWFRESIGRLRARIIGGDSCPNKGFSEKDRKRIEALMSRIRGELGQSVEIKYIESERCGT
jgi:hypothetical protein